jgi:hypothetical protein
MARRTTRATICLSMCSSQTLADCDQGSRYEGPGKVPRPVWPAHRALCTPVRLSWFKETGGLHNVRRSWVPTSILEVGPIEGNFQPTSTLWLAQLEFAFSSFVSLGKLDGCLAQFSQLVRLAHVSSPVLLAHFSCLVWLANFSLLV